MVNKDNELLQTNSFTYLGVASDTNLNRKNLINAVCCKLASGCQALQQARESLETNILRILYFAFIGTNFLYCSES